HEPPGDELGSGLVDEIGGGLRPDPLDQLADPVLQLNVCLESEELLGARRVSEAMADVARPVRPGKLGRDPLAETGLEKLGDLGDRDGTPRADVDRVTYGVVRVGSAGDRLDDVAH